MCRNLGVRRTVSASRTIGTHDYQISNKMLNKVCTDCKIEKSISEFYKSKDHKHGVMCYCKKCFNIRCSQRWVRRKIEAIRYKGSVCKRCQLHLDDSHYAVFEFHHSAPQAKDFDWSKMRMFSKEKLHQELDKCELLCANCHRIIHAEMSEM